ncbi:hypothetical protein SAMN04489841_1667 [Natrinema salaciae]|uniref:Uncharacterized protein n=1 Tax=Natrinema salaciae TaxID=1186196 RepID=A0A1H9FT84_9EURY|nr:hypothetical protein SAMN04489841_1667 [Natrinema salaciae]
MAGYQISKETKKLLENLLFGASGIVFTFLIVGDIMEYVALISDRYPMVLTGSLFAVFSFYFFEITKWGSKIDKRFRKSMIFTAVTLVILFISVAYIVISTEVVTRSSVVVFLIGYSLMLPIISLVAYLR